MRRNPIRGNQHGHKISYEKLKDMELQREYIEREKGKIPIIAMWPYYMTSLIEKRINKIKNGRML